MLKVLLVDDEPFILQGLEMLLDWESLGFEIAGKAANGIEALDFLKTDEADLILADIKMPGMSGLELLEKVRQDKNADIYFAFLSGYNDFAYAKKAICNSCVDYILKPVQKEELRSLLERVNELYADKQKRKQESCRQEEACRTAAIAHSFRSFHVKNQEETAERTCGELLCKQQMDSLVDAIEQNNKAEITKGVECVYEEMNRSGMDVDMVNLNVNYLLFRLVHLAVEQEENINQEEILRYITANAFEEGTIRDSRMHLIRFAGEYAEYLAQLRGKAARGIMGEIEKEVRENYAQNLTLKELSRKYFINSAYLGQLFRKKYDISFRDYLNNYRMERAAELLLHTDMKVYEVAERVGFHDLDYFINRFIMTKGCTPARFRKQTRENNV